MSPDKSVDVVAAVICRQRGSGFCYLLAKRPDDKKHAGFWEFPGGKIEPGETDRMALVRELGEELGIVPLEMSPWVYRQFEYPHARVCIRFFRVTAWQGQLQALEHNGLFWVDSAHGTVPSPILPANEPVIKMLRLPSVYALSAASEYGEEAELAAIEHALQNGLRLLQVRDKVFSTARRKAFTERARQLTRQYGALLIVNDDCLLAEHVEADGVHLSAGKLMQCSKRPDFEWVGASCHTRNELEHAENIEADYVLLGSVLPTASHPGCPGIGWNYFSFLVKNSRIPVYAIGGQSQSSLKIAESNGAHGIAMMRGWRL